MFADINAKNSLAFYSQIKYEWGKESYINKCTRKERIGIIWLKAGIWKLRWIRRGLEKGRCPLCWGEEDAKHILLKCIASKKWGKEWVNSNWSNMNEDLLYKKTVCCTNVNKIKLLGK
jgi:hypothetical protein